MFLTTAFALCAAAAAAAALVAVLMIATAMTLQRQEDNMIAALGGIAPERDPAEREPEPDLTQAAPERKPKHQTKRRPERLSEELIEKTLQDAKSKAVADLLEEEKARAAIIRARVFARRDRYISATRPGYVGRRP